MSPSSINRNREKVYLFLKSKGYSFINYISSRATILSEKIGENCFILENNVIQPYVTIGNNVIMWSGNHIGHHSIVDDSTFIASHSVVSGHVTIEKRCYLGVNSTISNGVHLSEETLVGAGALVNYNTESQAVIPGNKSIPSKVKSHRIRGI